MAVWPSFTVRPTGWDVMLGATIGSLTRIVTLAESDAPAVSVTVRVAT